MGNTPSKSHPSSHTTSSKSRRQRPQYNSDNESSAQLGQASSEHLQALPLAKWDTGTSDEAAAAAAVVPPSPTVGASNKKDRGSKKAVVKEVYTMRETVDVARASIEAVRGSPAMRSDTPREDRLDEPWGPVNEWHRDRELLGIGSWMDDERKK